MNSNFVNDLTRAVVKCGKDQYFGYAMELGVLPPQIKASTAHIPSPAGKLRALIEIKRGGVGDSKLIADLFKACSKVDEPILENVKRELELQGYAAVFLDYWISAGVAHSSVPTGASNGTAKDITLIQVQGLIHSNECLDSAPAPQGSAQKRLSLDDRLPEELLELLQYIGCKKWVELGKALLGWTEERVEDIPSDNPSIRTSQKLKKVFQEWMNRDGSRATVGEVFEAYRKIEKLGDVKQQLEKNGYMVVN